MFSKAETTLQIFLLIKERIWKLPNSIVRTLCQYTTMTFWLKKTKGKDTFAQTMLWSESIKFFNIVVLVLIWMLQLLPAGCFSVFNFLPFLRQLMVYRLHIRCCYCCNLLQIGICAFWVCTKIFLYGSLCNCTSSWLLQNLACCVKSTPVVPPYTSFSNTHHKLAKSISSLSKVFPKPLSLHICWLHKKKLQSSFATTFIVACVFSNIFTPWFIVDDSDFQPFL